LTWVLTIGESSTTDGGVPGVARPAAVGSRVSQLTMAAAMNATSARRGVVPVEVRIEVLLI
jgi:hypothetical protein